MSDTTVLVLFYFVCFCMLDICNACVEECQTPKHEPGQCIVIQDCPSVYNLLAVKPVSDDTINHLRKLGCGFIGKQPKVCCTITTKSPPEIPDLLPSREICGRQGQDKIFGGVGTTIGEYTWAALLEYQKPNGRRFSCGGSLISNRYILTAAHCLLRIPKTWKLISVRLGEHDLDTDEDCEVDTFGFKDCSDDPLDIAIEEQIAHEFYNPKNQTQPNDIALLRLSQEVEFTDFINPICLPLSERLKNKHYLGKNLTVTGWGKTETRSQSNIKLKVDIPVRPNTDCEQVYRRYGINIMDSQVCAGGVDRKDSCTGDSGGSLMVLDKTETEENFIQYGIVSFGPTQCGIENFPGIYTKVADYVEWIRNHMRP